MYCIVQVQEDEIVSAMKIGFIPQSNDESIYKVISEELYNEIKAVPCGFEENKDGEIISVTPAEYEVEEPPPSEVEVLREQVNMQQTLIDDLLFNIIPNMTGGEL